MGSKGSMPWIHLWRSPILVELEKQLGVFILKTRFTRGCLGSLLGVIGLRTYRVLTLLCHDMLVFGLGS